MTRAKQGEAVGVGGVVRGWECAVFIFCFFCILGNYLCFDFSSLRGFHFFLGWVYFWKKPLAKGDLFICSGFGGVAG